MPDAERYRFHSLLSMEEMRSGEEIELWDLLDKSVRQLDAFEGSVDAIIGFWDFPVTTMVPILCKRLDGLRCASLEAVVPSLNDLNFPRKSLASAGRYAWPRRRSVAGS